MVNIRISELVNLLDFSNKGSLKLRDNSLNKDAIKHGIQLQISKELFTNKEVDKLHGKFSPERSFNERVTFLKEALLNSNKKTLILGISGGVDSLTAGMMAQKAVDELNEETTCDYMFIAMKLPYGEQKDKNFVDMALDVINPSITEYVNIQSVVDNSSESLSSVYKNCNQSNNEIDFIKGNIKARTRMMIQYAVANTYNGLVIGTDHAAEAVTGFFTKFGDGACDVTPLTGLTKGQVREIAKAMGAPEALYLKTATADLEDLQENKPDEEALGISYQDIDDFLLCKPVSDEVFSKILNQFLKTKHKRDQPYNMFSLTQLFQPCNMLITR